MRFAASGMFTHHLAMAESFSIAQFDLIFQAAVVQDDQRSPV